MKRPPWATVVGILGIIFSCLGILSAGGEIIMPHVMELQGEMMSVMEEHSAQMTARMKSEMGAKESDGPSSGDSQAAPFPGPPPGMFKAMKRMWEVPQWYGTWALVSGILKALFCGLLLFASIGLLQTTPSSVPLFYWGAGLSIAMGVVKAVVAVSALAFMGMMMTFGGIFGTMIDIVLLVVVATGDKRAFRVVTQPATPPTPPPLY